MIMGLSVALGYTIWLTVALLLIYRCPLKGKIKTWYYRFAYYVQLPSKLSFFIWGPWMYYVVDKDNELVSSAQWLVSSFEMFEECSYGVLKVDTEGLRADLELGEEILPILIGCFLFGALTIVIESIFWVIYCACFHNDFMFMMIEE